MVNVNKTFCIKLATAGVLSVLLTPSAALAETLAENKSLSLTIPEKYFRLSRCDTCSNSENPESRTRYPSAPDTSEAQPAPTDYGGDNIKELSQKTADPTSDIALVFTQFAMTFNNGNFNRGDDKVAGNMVFQPIIPIPIYGRDDDQWRIVSRPTINFFANQPIPRGEPDRFRRESGYSDTLLPLPLALPKRITGRWLMALGPDFSFPTASDKAFGKQQWAAGVTGVLGYTADNWMVGMYPQYYWGFADQGRDDNVRQANFGNIFYWFWYNITDSWQVGFSPTINYNNQVKDGNRWNVPVGLGVSKVTKIGKTPVRIEIAAEYSVVNEDDFGEEARLKFNFIPIVARPINNPIFGE